MNYLDFLRTKIETAPVSGFELDPSLVHPEHLGATKFPHKKYKTIYADPPWNETGGGKIKRGADRHYTLMKTSDIISLPVADICEDNAHLYLWTTNNFLQDALKVMGAWGFAYKTTITWGKDRIGLGQYFRGQTERCLFGVRGVLPYKTVGNKRQQGTTLILAPRREHSRKPDEMRKMIERVSYSPYIELFAREQTVGWDAWGDELVGMFRLDVVQSAYKTEAKG